MKAFRYFLTAFLGLFFIAGLPPEFGRETNFFQGYVIPQPVIRVGLITGLKQATITASSGMKIYEVGREYHLLAEDADEVVIKVDKEKLTEKFVLLIDQTRDKQEAELLAADLSQKLIGRVVIEEKPEPFGPVYLLKYGEFLTRGQALDSIHQLEKFGYKDVWIIRESISLPEPNNVWLQIDHRLLSLNKGADLYFIPSFAQSFLSLNGKSYRGIFLLKNTTRGLSLVNILNLEDYLKGVVPLELSPTTFNALEALKAQAVAARTYALKNLGRNNHLGFDLTDTQSSQVYGGMSAEHPLSNQAVEETAGEVIVYRGELIDALYTSTCGGMTEDSENVFSGKPVPYLKSTACVYEKQPEWTLETNREYSAAWVKGRDILTEIFPLLAIGIIDYENKAGFFDEQISGREVADALKRILGFKKLNQTTFKVDGLNNKNTLDFISLSQVIVEFFGWQEKATHFVLESEVKYLLRDSPQFKELTESERKALAYLIQSGVFPSYLREDDLRRPVSRAEFAYVLKKCLSWLDDLYHQGTFITRKGNFIEVLDKHDKRLLILPVASYLLRKIEEGTFPARELTLLGGESLRWIEKDGVVQLLEVNYPPNTNVLDRNSRYSRWTVRVSREELERNIQKYYPEVGRLIDLKVGRRGKSNRVAELQIIGEKSRVTVQGLKIKWVLNLKDTLFFIDREYDQNQQLSHFVFTGRGWGHGVGLCQVGAYGMAIAGANYKDILQHYYKNVKIEKIQ